MRVATETDHISHAVLSKNTAQNFGISDDPAFFQILSQSLYKDPMLAMVREVICNAWDAHIDAGKSDTPIKITLDDNYFTVEDFGKGIPDALIQPIYGVYGASTKKNDGRQTGGFGLGCKSPFSYHDHFQVTSSNGGKRTIYSMSRSSAQVGGRPGITTIASFNSDRTGVEVKVPMNPEKQNHRFQHLIEQIVYNGDIKATLNGQLLNVMGLSTAESGVCLVYEGDDVPEKLSKLSHVHLRYGNVIYPLESCAEYDSLLRRVLKISERFYSCDIVLQAPADSISVTPSRESLTLSEMTIQTVKDLLLNFLTAFHNNPKLLEKKKELIADYIQDSINSVSGDHYKAVNDHLSSWEVPGVPKHYKFHILSTQDDFARIHAFMDLASRHRRMSTKTWLKHMATYMEGLIQDGYIDRGMWQSWFKLAMKHHKIMRQPDSWATSNAETKFATRWWWEQVGVPLINNLTKHVPGFDRKQLSAYNDNSTHNYSPRAMGAGELSMSWHAKNLQAFIAPLVVVSQSASDVKHRMKHCSNRFDSIYHENFFHYQVGKSKKQAEEVVEALGNVPGIIVLDLTGRLPYEQRLYEQEQYEREQRRLKRAARGKSLRKSKIGMVRLDQMINDATGKFEASVWSTLRDPEKLKEPEFVVQFSNSKDHQYDIYHLRKNALNDLITLFGERGGITNNSGMMDRYIEAGSLPLATFLEKELIPMMARPSIQAHLSFMDAKIEDALDRETRWERAGSMREFIVWLAHNPHFSSIIPSGPQLSKEDRAIVRLWREFYDRGVFLRTDPMKKLANQIDSISIDKGLLSAIKKVCSNDLLDALNFKQVYKLFKRAEQDPKFNIQPVIDSITLILK